MTLPNGAAGIDYTTWGISGDGSLPDQATRTKEAIQAALRTSYTSQLNSSSVWATSVGNIIEGILKQVWTALTNNAGSYDATKTAFENLAHWAESLITGGISAALQAFDTFLSGIPNLSTWLETFKTLINGLLGITNFSSWVAIFKSVVDTFSTLFGSLGSTVWTVLNSAITTLASLFGTFGSTIWTAINDVVAFFSGITGRGAWLNIFKTAIDTLKTLVDSLGSTVWTVLSEIINFFSSVFTGSGSIGTWLGNISGNLLSVIGTITGRTITSIEDGITKLTQFTQSLPNIGSLISGLMGGKVNPTTGTSNTLPDLIWWASNLLTSTSVVPSFNLTGVIPPELLALIGVGTITDVAANLITDAGFGSSAALQAGVGWTWDSGINSTGSTGGAAKLACDGGVKYMFSNLIAASPGQQLTVSVKTKYTKGSSAQANIICAVRTYQGSTVKSTDTVASLTATGTTSVGISGADAAGFKTITGTYTVPANVDTVRLVLGVTTGTSGTTVWFDEASLTKTSLLPQDLVHNLGNTLESLLPVDQFNTLLTGVANTTGATVQQVIDVINGKLTPDSALDGAKILAGNISSEFIAELKATWSQLGGSISGSTSTAPTTIDGAAAEFASLVNNITGLSSLIGGNTRDIFRIGGTVDGHTTLISGIDSKLQGYSSQIKDQITVVDGKTITTATQLSSLATRVAALETKTSTTPTTVIPVTIPTPVTPVTPTTPTVAPPTLISVSDDFERASLSSNWTLSTFNTNGSTLGILNSHDAYMATPPTATLQARIAAIYAGTGRASLGEYQKISATLGTKAGIPALGTQGFNDLIGRAASATMCLFCRFYPDGRVVFGYRQNSWTDVQLGTATAPQQLTGATPIEFYIGDKSVNDQTKLYAKVGTAVLGPTYVGAGILATMGKGWGFAMGHGLSDGTFTFGVGVPQVPATMNFWAAQEQS